MLGMDDGAAQSILFPSKPATLFNALKSKTGLILAKAIALRISANLEPFTNT